MTAAEFDQKINAIADTFIAAFREARSEMMRDVNLMAEDAGSIPEVMKSASTLSAMNRVAVVMTEDVE